MPAANSQSSPSPAAAPAALRHPEVLAPAGDWDCVHAAVENGADAVYFGLDRFHAACLIYPCHRSRKDLASALSAPHESIDSASGQPPADDEPVYPAAWRPPADAPLPPLNAAGLALNWRFRVPDGREITFTDAHFGEQRAVCGRDFGDFLVWRKDGFPSYQLASVLDDMAMGVTEVVRGADLIRSTFRQLLLLEALGAPAPAWYHAPLLTDEHGVRLAKRHDALSLRALRSRGLTPAEVLALA